MILSPLSAFMINLGGWWPHFQRQNDITWWSFGGSASPPGRTKFIGSGVGLETSPVSHVLSSSFRSNCQLRSWSHAFTTGFENIEAKLPKWFNMIQASWTINHPTWFPINHHSSLSQASWTITNPILFPINHHRLYRKQHKLSSHKATTANPQHP